MRAHRRERNGQPMIWTDLLGPLLVVSSAWFGASLLGEDLGASLGLGPLSHHMTQHILLMNVAAPLAALVMLRLSSNFPRATGRRTIGAGLLAAATVMQIALLWSWHLPPAFSAAGNDPALMAVMHLSLFIAALWFWMTVLGTGTAGRWQSILSLLLTGKLFCLLAVILVFAPRPLYPLFSHHGAQPASLAAALEDQQLAGLMMVVACPLTYVLAGVILATLWLYELEREGVARSPLAVSGQ